MKSIYSVDVSTKENICPITKKPYILPELTWLMTEDLDRARTMILTNATDIHETIYTYAILQEHYLEMLLPTSEYYDERLQPVYPLRETYKWNKELEKYELYGT